jgi:hypothetical protein
MGIQIGSAVINNIFGTRTIEVPGPEFIVSSSVIGLLSGSYADGSTWVSTTGSAVDVFNSPLVGQAANGRWQFNGTNDYLRIPQATLNATFTTNAAVTQSFTFLFYGTIGDLTPRRALFGASGFPSYTAGGDCILRTDTTPPAGTLHLQLRGPGGATNQFTVTGVSGSLLNLAITQNSTGNQSVYQNGVLVASSASFGVPYYPWRSSDSSTGAFIGYNDDTDTDNYNGQLGGTFLYNRVLSATEISSSAQAFFTSSAASSSIQIITSASAVFLGTEKIFPGAAPIVYLFDTYSGARFGYSLRKLSSTYTAAAIRVRRSSDNTEQDIGFVGEALDTASLSSFVGANNGFVTKWYDQSGNSRTGSQTTAANQPRIVNAGTIETENGKPSINFGTNANNWWLDLPTGALAASNLTSYFQVATVNTFAGSNTAVFGPSADNSKGIEVLQAGVLSQPSYLRLNNVVKNNASNPLWTDNAQGMFTFITNASSTAAWNNSSSVTLSSTSAMGTLNFTGVYAIGRYAGSSGNVMSGEWQELVVYQTDQTSNRTGIQSNINSYYAIY